MKKLFSILLIMLLVLLIPLSAEAKAAAAPSTNYLALGDSIAAGTDNEGIQVALNGILDKYPKITLRNYLSVIAEIKLLQSNPNKYLKGSSFRYTYQFRDYLAVAKGPVKMTDWSVSGYTSVQLLRQLRTLSLAKLRILKRAQYITISIGGNDVLAAGADSGFSKIDTKLLTKNIAAYKTNLIKTLNLIKKKNPKAKIILLNFFNLYHPQERSTDGQNLHDFTDKVFKSNAGYNNLGDWLMSLPGKYANLKIADTYGLFEKVNEGETQVPTVGTLAATSVNQPYNMSPVAFFPSRFNTGNDTVRVIAPYNIWDAYMYEWNRMTVHGGIEGFTPQTAGVAFDVYNHFYNPNNYVLGHDAATSQIYRRIQKQCNAVTWKLMKPIISKYIGNYAKWRDVHCTELGHSLITRAHIDALNN